MTANTSRHFLHHLALLSCGAALVVLLAGCENGRTDPVPIKAAILLDVEGMQGGRNLWLASDGTGVVQVVGHLTQEVGGLPEKRYRVQFDKAAVAEVERLVGAHRFMDLNLKLRVGPPAPGHPEIAILTKAGGRAVSCKREDDRHPDFDPLYSHLLLLAQKLDGAELISEGVFDWDWHPDGFPPPKDIRGGSK